MISEERMKQAMQGYIDGFNRADPEAIIALYADDATVEDPVGSGKVLSGKPAIAEFYRGAIKTGAKLSLVAPIRASYGNSAAMAFDVKLQMPQGPAVIQVIDVMTFNDAGQFSSMRAYWGKTDMKFKGDAPL